jgi:hypothetical protein
MARAFLFSLFELARAFFLRRSIFGPERAMARSRKPRGKPDVGKLLNRLAAEEEEFLRREFLAPALRGSAVQVRIGKVVCTIRTAPADFEGWGVFQPLSHTEANLVREATLAERRGYLELFPKVRLILCRRRGPAWFGSAASFGDARIELQGLAPICLADEVQLFDGVSTRYDGRHFWFDELDPRQDPAAAAYLRASLNDRLEPGRLERRGLTAEQRAAYEAAFWEAVQPPPARPRRRRPNDPEPAPAPERDPDPVRQRLRESLSHAGAELVEYLERPDSFRVTFTVAGQRHTSSVDKDDLTVHVAGICLSGQDQKFDLGSLVGVLREAGGGVLPIGEDNDGIDEDEYWRLHPRRD